MALASAADSKMSLLWSSPSPRDTRRCTAVLWIWHQPGRFLHHAGLVSETIAPHTSLGLRPFRNASLSRLAAVVPCIQHLVDTFCSLAVLRPACSVPSRERLATAHAPAHLTPLSNRLRRRSLYLLRWTSVFVRRLPVSIPQAGLPWPWTTYAASDSGSLRASDAACISSHLLRDSETAVAASLITFTSGARSKDLTTTPIHQDDHGRHRLVMLSLRTCARVAYAARAVASSITSPSGALRYGANPGVEAAAAALETEGITMDGLPGLGAPLRRRAVVAPSASVMASRAFRGRERQYVDDGLSSMLDDGVSALVGSPYA
ncbi:hypothetical protein B0H13DRAFT_2320145 [Mycena leptocephala]|nr:hypothetical protein B0H13DRAFT_2320145 [Mycena leptocephala]